MGTFGKATIGGTNLALTATTMDGTNYQMTPDPDMRLASITVWCSVIGDPIRVAIYDIPDNIQTGSPGALLWGSKAFIPEVGWNEVEIPEEERPLLIANHWYWLGERVQDVNTKFNYDTGVANSRKYKTNLSDFYVDWPNPFPSPSQGNYQWSIYGTTELAPLSAPAFPVSKPRTLGFTLFIDGFDVSPDVLSATIKNTFGQIDSLTFQLHDPKGKYVFGEHALRFGQVIDGYARGFFIYRGYVNDWDDNVDAEKVNQGVFSLGLGQQLNWSRIYDTFIQKRAEEIAEEIAMRARLKYMIGRIPQTAQTTIFYDYKRGQQAIQEAFNPENASFDVTPSGEVVSKPNYKFFSGYAMTPSLKEGFNIGNVRISKKSIGWYCDYYTLIGGEAIFPPPTGDEWTEDVADQWDLFTGSGSVWDKDGGPVRSFYTRYTSSPLACRGSRFPKTKDLNFLVDTKFFSELRFWRISRSNYTGGSGYVHVHSTDSKYAEKTLSKADSWTETNIPLTSFTLNGGFDWNTSPVNWLEFYYCQANYGGWVHVDGLHFWGKQIKYTAENIQSRRTYGGAYRLPHKEVETDSNIHDPNRVIALAEAYVNDYNHGQPRQVLEMDYYGVPDLRAGDWVWIDIPSRKIKGYYQVQEITHSFSQRRGYVCSLLVSGLPIQTARYFADLKDRLREVEYKLS